MSCCHQHLQHVLLQPQLSSVKGWVQRILLSSLPVFRQPALQEDLLLMGSSDLLLLGRLCSSCPCKLTSRQLNGLSKRCQVLVAAEQQHSLLVDVEVEALCCCMQVPLTWRQGSS